MRGRRYQTEARLKLNNQIERALDKREAMEKDGIKEKPAKLKLKLEALDKKHLHEREQLERRLGASTAFVEEGVPPGPPPSAPVGHSVEDVRKAFEETQAILQHLDAKIPE